MNRPALPPAGLRVARPARCAPGTRLERGRRAQHPGGPGAGPAPAGSVAPSFASGQEAEPGSGGPPRPGHPTALCSPIRQAGREQGPRVPTHPTRALEAEVCPKLPPCPGTGQPWAVRGRLISGVQQAFAQRHSSSEGLPSKVLVNRGPATLRGLELRGWARGVREPQLLGKPFPRMPREESPGEAFRAAREVDHGEGRSGSLLLPSLPSPPSFPPSPPPPLHFGEDSGSGFQGRGHHPPRSLESGVGGDFKQL